MNHPVLSPKMSRTIVRLGLVDKRSSLRNAVGSKVKHLKPGDRVAMEPGAACRICGDCKSGRYEVRHISNHANCCVN